MFEYENLNLCVPASLRALSGAAPPGGQTSLGVDSCKCCYDLPMHGLALTSFLANRIMPVSLSQSPLSQLTRKAKETSQRKASLLLSSMKTEVTTVFQSGRGMGSEGMFVLS